MQESKKMRFAVKVAYVGFNYNGYQRQKHTQNTIESKIIDALKRSNYISSLPESKLQAASRTDKGVSAIGQVIAFSTDKSKIYLGKINHYLPSDIRAWAYTAVGNDFNPRKQAYLKHYVYILHNEEINDFQRIKEIADILKGEHDFKNLYIRDKRKVITKIKIDKIDVVKNNSFILVHFFAERFLYGQIRKIISLMLMYDMHKISDTQILKILSGKCIRINIPPADSKRLILLDVFFHNLKFNPSKTIIKKFIQKLTLSYIDHLMKSKVLLEMKHGISKNLEKSFF